MRLTLLSTTIINDALPTELGADVGDLPTLFQGTQTDADRLIEWAGRVCYLSTAKQGHAPNFLQKRIEEGHTDIFEHITATFRVRGWLPLLLPYVNRFAVVTPPPGTGVWGQLGGFFLGRSQGDWLVSGNLRVWMNLINQGLGDALPTLKALAPQTFAAFPGTAGEPSAPLLYKRVLVPLFTDGPRRVICLGASIPDGLPLDELLAHGTATFLVEGVSRTATHQLVRHRLGSFCLDGDTVVYAFRRPEKEGTPKHWTMRQLWEWSQDPKRKGRLKLIRLRGMNERQELIPVPIKQVIASGVQKVYRVTTESHRVIQATARHQFLTPDGWRRLAELNVGDRVWANGIPAYKNPDYLRQRYLVENMERALLAQELGVADATLGKWLRKFGLQKPKRQYPNRKPGHGRPGQFTAEQRALISERMTGERNHRWLGDQASSGAGHLRAWKGYEAVACSRCGSTKRVQRHHKDRNPVNNEPDNIAILCEMCHKAEHFGQVVLTAFPDRIVAIEPVGEVETYDLEIDHPCHNFVANGFVVHNSQASQRYISLEKGGWNPIIPPKIAANPETLAITQEFFEVAEAAYAQLRDHGILAEDARFLLPGAADSRLVVTMPLWGWANFLEQREAKAAQWEIRSMAYGVRAGLHTLLPLIF